MIRSAKILWGEGLFLRPQHFQRQDAYHEWRQAERSLALQPHGWGLRQLQLDTGALATGMVRITGLQAIFPDGDLYCAPQDDELPAALSLSSLPAGMGEVTLHLALAPMREAGSNFAGEGDDGGGVRFVQRAQAAGDWFTEAVEASVTTLRRRAQLLTDPEPRAHLVSLPLLRLRRLAGGGFEVDADFVAPVLTLAAAPALKRTLDTLLDVLKAKADALYGVHREPSRHVIEFRSGDIASFWLLHTCNAAFAGLSHLQRHPLLHPERLFERLLELAGALMTFSRSHGLSDLPAYEHQAPQAGFHQLDTIVRDLLETVISTRCFSITLEEVRTSFHQARLDSQKIDARTRFFLGVQAAVPAAELVQLIPQQLKLGTPDDVDKLLLSAMQGVRLVHAPQVPSAIPVRPGALYFGLEPRGPLYERMLQARTLTLYAPSGLPDLQLELFALNDGQ
ncbi:type VI secretion system baseplate subunit TssK [Azohydromonas aeria]|uniref:type VI secretion system baseplate subunit TssK n=1 Tax=Azohydromonas aeria TaxID=2590212 RepID=UPI0012FC29ED|nr:type VI secretion system baseplate subunit TssK [Azohydromonas aeria]